VPAFRIVEALDVVEYISSRLISGYQLQIMISTDETKKLLERAVKK
jgi:hypothetical protein